MEITVKGSLEITKEIKAALNRKARNIRKYFNKELVLIKFFLNRSKNGHFSVGVQCRLKGSLAYSEAQGYDLVICINDAQSKILRQLKGLKSRRDEHRSKKSWARKEDFKSA